MHKSRAFVRSSNSEKKLTRPDGDVAGRVIQIGARMDGAGADLREFNQ